MRLVISIQNAHIEDKTYDWLGEFLWTLELLKFVNSTVLTNNRSAEITSGILCSCLPALPAFLRHFYARAAPSNPSKYPNGGSIRRARLGHNSDQPWISHDNSRLLEGSYLELAEDKTWHSGNAQDLRPTTTIKGGAFVKVDKHIVVPDALHKRSNDLGQQNGDMANVKTVRLE